MRALKFQKMAQGAQALQFGGSAGASKSSSSSSYEDFTNSEEYKKMTPFQQQQYKDILSAGGNEMNQKLNTEGSDAMKNALDQQMAQYNKVLGGADDQAGLNSMLGDMRDDASDNLGQITSQIGGAANMSGAAGGSRSGIAQGMAASNAQKQLGKDQNKLRYDHNQQQTQNRMAATAGVGQAAQGYAGYQQATGDQQLDRLGKIKDLYSGDMGGEQLGTGSEHSKGTSKSKSKSAEAGGSYGLSDEKLKKNIKNTGKKIEVHKTGAEIPQKSFEYKKEAVEDYGMPEGRQIGVLAQDVQKEDPSAVGKMVVENGKKKKKKAKAVDYSKLDDMWDNI
jgi:hypothetical protein